MRFKTGVCPVCKHKIIGKKKTKTFRNNVIQVYFTKCGALPSLTTTKYKSHSPSITTPAWCKLVTPRTVEVERVCVVCVPVRAGAR